MKLAAVASAAVMLAPVAMGSVSSFAKNTTANGVHMPAANVLSVDSAYNAGTALQVTAPYISASQNDISAQLKTIAALNDAPKTVDDDNYVDGMYAQQAQEAGTAANKAQGSAVTAYNGVVDIYQQMNLDNQGKYKDSINGVNDTYKQTVADVSQLWDDGKDTGLVGLASQADSDAKAYRSATVNNHSAQEIANLKDTAAASLAAYKAKLAAFTTAANKYGTFATAVTDLADKMSLLTNNGAVAHAAKLAAAAIEGMPAGANRDAKVKLFNTAYGTFLAATQKDVSVAAVDADKNAAAINSAAESAVNTMLTIAGNAVDQQASKVIGVATVNYNPNYGIQIWSKAGEIVRFDAKDAATWNTLHPNNKVKVGDAKKLQGQTSWKIFKNTYTANGTTYYNLGGDQYIDAAYVTVK